MDYQHYQQEFHPKQWGQTIQHTSNVKLEPLSEGPTEIAQVLEITAHHTVQEIPQKQ